MERVEMGATAEKTPAMRLDFEQLTGKGVKVAVVDSGLCPQWSRMKVAGGVNLTGEGAEDDWHDEIGHGTACAGIIARKAPEAELYVVKIFTAEIVSNVERLVRAIRWCIEARIDVVNLSVAATEVSARDELQGVCDRARAQGMSIVAAVDHEGLESYPASMPGVLGVAAAKVRGRHDYHFDEAATIQLLARGDLQRVDWLEGQQVASAGSSFAAPHVAGIVALMRQAHVGVVPHEVDELLVRHSLPERPALAEGQEAPLAAPGTSGRQPTLKELCGQGDVDWIGRATLFPYNKEMHGLIRFRDLLPFEVAHVVDVVGNRTIGKDSGEAIGAEASGVQVAKHLGECLEDCDTLVLGYLQELSRIRRRDMMRECLAAALAHGKHVYSLSQPGEANADLVAAMGQAGLRVAAPLLNGRHFERVTESFDSREPSRKPVLGVFGTSAQQGKFTAQLALRTQLLKAGYRVGQLGTEHQSELFGFDFTFPNGYDAFGTIQLPVEAHIPMLQSAMVGIEREDPDLVIVGSQSGLVPHSYAEKSPQYTLAALILLMGTVPDAYILVVNANDEETFIQEHLDALRIYGKGDTVLLVFPDRKREVVFRLGKPVIVQEQMTPGEIRATAQRLEERFELPATEVVSAEGRMKMTAAVEDYFARPVEGAAA